MSTAAVEKTFEEVGPDRLSLTLPKLEHLYEILDYSRPEGALISTAHLLIKTLTDDEIDHGIARSMLECHKAIAKDIIDRAKGDEPIANYDLIAGLPRLNAALAKSQSEFPIINKSRTATKKYQREGVWKEYTYAYADLADILKAVSPVLGKNGIAITQPFVRRGNERLYLVTQLRHASGEVLTSAGLVLPNEEAVTPQEFGSQHSYWRRYDLSGMICVSAMEDDDGQFSARSGHDFETSDRPGRQAKGKAENKTESDKKNLQTGDPNAGHGAKDTPSTAASRKPVTPSTPAPTPVVTDEKVTVKLANDSEKVVDWKKIVGRVKGVTLPLEAKNKNKSKYVQVVIEGLGTSNRKEEGKEYKPAQLFHCFHTSLFDCLQLTPGEVCAFYFDPAPANGTYYQNIEDVLRIGDRVFVDGKPKPEPESKAEPVAEKPNPEGGSSPALFDTQGSTAK